MFLLKKSNIIKGVKVGVNKGQRKLGVFWVNWIMHFLLRQKTHFTEYL